MQYRKEHIVDFPEYQIDTNGIVYNKNGSVKKFSINGKGYCIVNFYVKRKRTGIAIHTLVAKQFICNNNPIIKTQVNHKDGNKNNNCVENLEWVTPKENAMHSVSVLKKNLGQDNPNSKKVIAKCEGKKLCFPSIIDASRFLFPTKSTKELRYVQNSICRALSGKRKTYMGYTWSYL